MFGTTSTIHHVAQRRRRGPTGVPWLRTGAGALALVTALVTALAACDGAAPRHAANTAQSASSTAAPTAPVDTVALPTSTSTYTDRVEATISAPGPEDITAAAGSVWVRTHDEHVLRIDPKTNRIVADIPIDQHSLGLHKRCMGIGNDGSTVWACIMHDEEAGIGQIDPRTNKVSRYLPVGKAKEQMRFPANARGLWVLTDGGSKLALIEPASGERTPYALDARYAHVAADDIHLLATSVPTGDVVMLDPGTGAVTTRTTLHAPRLAALTRADAWVDTEDGLVRLGLDLQPKAVYPEITGLMYGDLIADADSVWVREKDGPITRIDAATGKVVERITPARQLGAGNVTVAFGSIWTTSEDDDQIIRLRLE